MRVGVFPKLSCLATYYLLLITYYLLLITYYLLLITYITLLVFFPKNREVYVTFRMCFKIQHQ